MAYFVNSLNNSKYFWQIHLILKRVKKLKQIKLINIGKWNQNYFHLLCKNQYFIGSTKTEILLSILRLHVIFNNKLHKKKQQITEKFAFT
jgi:hypothetical protein